ncbi:hypothetical protein LZ198_22315 [Myxococcus sp. K15C18031901]|uniref:hypothetical protein n=1 Tax=Myxococcus dinghuensis TaxID=2906761 RepID=UPI0020A8345B|nr:hypothetical protein [Myxococcus dinghuensis]MCP3101615.1 hypothetical protein [Myxococcus dinghuensis]
MLRAMFCIVVVGTLPGCFRMSVRSGAPREGLPVQRMGSTLVYGLTTSNVAAPECQHGLSRVDVYWPWWSPLVYMATFGIVTPLRAEYVCAEAASAAQAPVPDSIPPL